MWKCEDTCVIKGTSTCCFSCERLADCDKACSQEPETCGKSIKQEINEEQAMTLFESEQTAIMRQVAALTEQKKALEEQEKQMKDQLKAAMEKYGIKSFKTDFISITYVAETMTSTLDSKKVQAKYPKIFAECSRESARSAYVKITVKGGDKE